MSGPMNQLVKQYIVRREELSLVLLPSKLVWCPEHQTLFMADSHFGKASTFRKTGLAVPSGTTQRMLDRLTEQIGALGAKNLMILGDFLHSNVRAKVDFEQELFEWRVQNAALEITLVKGNHDKRSKEFYDGLRMEVVASTSLQWKSIELCHDPKDVKSERFALCGHLHPALRLAGRSLPCFWLRANQLVLPAFGEFTGSARFAISDTDLAIAVVDDSVAVLDRSIFSAGI